MLTWRTVESWIADVLERERLRCVNCEEDYGIDDDDIEKLARELTDRFNEYAKKQTATSA